MGYTPFVEGYHQPVSMVYRNSGQFGNGAIDNSGGHNPVHYNIAAATAATGQAPHSNGASGDVTTAKKVEARHEPAEFAAAPVIAPVATKTVKKRRSKEPESGIPRPRNKFLIFRAEVEPILKIENPEMTFTQICEYIHLHIIHTQLVDVVEQFFFLHRPDQPLLNLLCIT